MVELNEMDDILKLALFQFIIISSPHKFVYKKDTELHNSYSKDKLSSTLET